MSLYNMLFGMNAKADLILAVIGLKKHDVERFRDVHVTEGGKQIAVHSRTGGGNRADYPQLLMRHLPGWVLSEDEDYDNTYCDDYFAIPDEWQDDVAKLSDVLTHGIRPEFAAHLAKTINREPTPGDMESAARETERRELARTAHTMLNGHTFVPHNDTALLVALKIAEANGGQLRTAWGIAPMGIVVKRDFYPFPGAKDAKTRIHWNRIDVSCVWEVDEKYWHHMLAHYETDYPLTFAKIREIVAKYPRVASNG